MAISNDQKQKSGSKKPLNKNQTNKRNRVRNARTIRTEAVSASSANKPDSNSDLSESGGMLRMDQFIKSRKFEIEQLLLAMHKSKVSASTRVFQALPRKLRRRTASHNVKRIPKRMRNRALREMLKSDQKVVVAKRSRPKETHGLTARQLYKARMSVKLLRLASRSIAMKLALPSGVTASTCNIRQRIRILNKSIKNAKKSRARKLNNALGSYDNTKVNQLAERPKGRIKYWKRQREFVWLPSHIWNAKRSHMIKRWGYQLPWSPTQKCFRLTHRIGSDTVASDGVLCMDSSFIGTMIIHSKPSYEGTLKSIISSMTNGRAVLSKYYSSKSSFEGLLYDFTQESTKEILGPIVLIWVDIETVLLRLHPALYTTVFEGLKKYMDKLDIQDCRYSIASITLRGSKTLSAIASVVRSTKNSKSFEHLKMVSKVTDYSVLPSGTMFAMEAMDPRHLPAPKKLHAQTKTLSADEIILLRTETPQQEIHDVLKLLCDPKRREESYRNQQTLKQLARRRQNLLNAKLDGTVRSVIPFKDGVDPSIPLIIFKRPVSNDWVMLMPWFWHLPFWYQLHRIPRVYNIGLRQFQQLSYESASLYFPDDFPFTSEGFMEGEYKKHSLRARWERKPPGKKLLYEKLRVVHKFELPSFSGEIGDYFGCDWTLLQILRNGLEYLKKGGAELKLIEPDKTTQFDENGGRIISVLNDLFELYKDVTDPTTEYFISSSKPPVTLARVRDKDLVSVSSQTDITDKPLPVIAVSVQLTGRGHPRDNARIYEIPAEDIQFWRSVNKGIYRANGKLDHDVEVPKPAPHHLVGFITSGTFNLGQGKGTGNGFLDARFAQGQNEKFVLIRNIGTNVYRLACWSAISI